MAGPAGKLRHRVGIQAPPSAATPQDAYGEPSGPPTTEATRWAAINAVAGGEVWRGQQVSAGTTHVVEMRYYAGLTPAKRLLWGTRVLNINLVRNPDGIKDWLIVECEEEV